MNINRLAVLDRGEPAVRVLNGVRALEGDPIVTVLVHRSPTQPWYAREADEILGLDAAAGEHAPEGLAARLAKADIDAVWLGALVDRDDVLLACERAGLAVVGPSSDVVAAMRAAVDAERSDMCVEPSARCRRIEVEVLADDTGTIWCLDGRDASIRLDGRSLLTESPAAGTDQALLDRIRDHAIGLTRRVDYRGAGVLVYAHDGASIRLDAVDVVAPPVHATTEELTNTSVVRRRVRIARGEQLPTREPVAEGVVVGAHLLAELGGGSEDGEGAVGSAEVALLALPSGTGVRIDANRRHGDLVTADDPLLAVITAWGPDRPKALLRLQRALERTSVVLSEGRTNRSLLLAIVQHPDVLAGEVDDTWLDRHLDGLRSSLPDPVALLAAAVEAYEADRELAQTAFFGAAARGRPRPPRDVGGRIQLSYRGASYVLSVDRTGPHTYSICHEGAIADVAVDRLDRFERRITCRGRRHRVLVSPTDAGVRIEVDGVAHRVDRDDGTVVRSDWPALVVSVPVAPGDLVRPGDPIAVLESMKMETTVSAPFEGEVTAVEVAPNSQIERGAPLIRLRPRRGRSDPDGPDGVIALTGFERPFDASRKPCLRVYEPLGNYLLGFDLSPEGLHRLLVQQRRIGEIAEPDDVDLIACEAGLLDIYADLGALSRPRTEHDPADDSVETAEESTQEYLTAFVQWLDADRAGLDDAYRERLLRALGRYGVHDLERSPELETALTWLFRSLARLDELSDVVVAILRRRLEYRRELAPLLGVDVGARLDRLASATLGRQQAIADLARDVRFHFFDEPPMEEARNTTLTEMAGHFEALVADPDDDRDARIDRLVACPYPLRGELLRQWRMGVAGDDPSALARRRAVTEVYVRRYYRMREVAAIEHHELDGRTITTADYEYEGSSVHLVVAYLPLDELGDGCDAISSHLAGITADELVVDVIAWRASELIDVAETAADLCSRVELRAARPVHRLTVTITSDAGAVEEHLRTQSVTLRQRDDGSWSEDELLRNLHPMLADRLELWRLSEFELERRPSPEDVYLYAGVARGNPADRRLFALTEVRELVGATDSVTGERHYPRLERNGLLALAAMRTELARYPGRERPVANRLVIDITAPWTIPQREVGLLSKRFGPLARRVGLEKVVLKVRIPDEDAPGGLRPAVLHFEGVGQTVLVREDRAGDAPVQPLGAYQQKLLTATRFGVPYPYEIVRLLTRRGERDGRPADHFVELDLAPGGNGDTDDRLEPVDRPPGQNSAHIVVGLITHHTAAVPEGVQRIALLSDPTQGLGNLAEPECRRVNAALAYALEHRIPVEWFAVSSGALISMDSGTENMDWIALTLRRLIEFTQAGGEINIVVTGINVGGQPYWNAEATMLMHTKGILIMSPASTMVLTGKQALDFSGAVSADDNQGIGGYERVMGPNGQAQYFAASFSDACEILRRHYELTYVVPGERFPRRRATSDPTDRDVRSSHHAELPGSPFTKVGDVFSSETNPDRKQPFDMRSVMAAVADADTDPLERWRDLRDGDTSIVWDTTIGGIPVCLLGLESHTVPRRGFVPADGPPSWTSGTLFPHSSRKTARAINAASGGRPLVVLANLSGFDGSPESMRRRQLEYGAEIGRAVTNFDGPIVFVVVSRYHGGAFVVFSKTLNASMEIAAVEGSFASVIGGAPAAATVFAREVKQRTQRDERVKAASEAAGAASGTDAGSLRTELARLTAEVRSEKLGEVAREFDAVHTIERAQRVGSVDRIIPAGELRSYVIDALERGMARF